MRKKNLLFFSYYHITTQLLIYFRAWCQNSWASTYRYIILICREAKVSCLFKCGSKNTICQADGRKGQGKESSCIEVVRRGEGQTTVEGKAWKALKEDSSAGHNFPSYGVKMKRDSWNFFKRWD